MPQAVWHRSFRKWCRGEARDAGSTGRRSPIPPRGDVFSVRGPMKTAAARFAALALVTLALAASCNRTPTAPSIRPPPPPEATPPQPRQPVIERVELTAPRTLAPATSTQLRVIGYWSDGTTQDITDTASFHSSRPEVLTISTGGMAAAIKVGESFISAQTTPSVSLRVGGIRPQHVVDNREIVVVPAAPSASADRYLKRTLRVCQSPAHESSRTPA